MKMILKRAALKRVEIGVLETVDRDHHVFMDYKQPVTRACPLLRWNKPVQSVDML